MSEEGEKRTFETALLELEGVVRELEDSRLGLEEALARYEHGVGLIKQCQEQLLQAEQRILLLARGDNDQPVLQPFKHEATALTRGEPARRVRKKPDDPD